MEEKNEYKEIGIDGSLVGVEVKVGAKSHGFIRYNPDQLKDPRYGRVVGALYDVADMTGIVRELQEAEKR
ncbi:MAG: hypothetical protein HYR55_01515 [Acidobacteria bacterium]|nr:hypothetical protein [Acidobacteriota bacterium]MBI3657766.1 hypothetical protein [Acidobacteriota bacterium]